MTPKQAAQLIGISSTQVRYLIRRKKLRASKIKYPGGYYYSISRREAERYRDTKQNGGWPRGQSYTWRR